MSIHATRNTFAGMTSYHIGNGLVCPITQEEYEELAAIEPEYCLKEGKSWIVYMHSFPTDIIAKYAKRVLESPAHKDKDIKALEHKLADIRITINNLKELHAAAGTEQQEQEEFSCG